jgi:hypothetical protein
MKDLQSIAWPNPQKLKEIGIGFLLIGALTLVGWVSVVQLYTIHRSQSQIHNTLGLERQVSQLRSHYLRADPDALDSEIHQVERLLIENYTQLAQWAQGLQEMGNQWNLLLQYRILNMDRTASPIHGVALVPMEIQIHAKGTQSAYRPYLQFVRAFTQSGPKVEIRKMTLRGDGKKATHLTIGFAVWMKALDSVEL